MIDAIIDVLVPVLSRPQNAAPVYQSLRRTASVEDVNFVWICSRGDDAQIEASTNACGAVMVVDWQPGPGDYARKINAGVEHTAARFILNGSDDLEFTPGWMENALAMMEDHISVVATNDDLNGQVKTGLFGTHSITRRSYILEQGATADGVPGLLLHEGYDHNYVDRELCSVARHRGVYAFAKESIIRHRHPLFRTAQWDDTYRKGFERHRQDRDLYISRAHLFGGAGLSSPEQNLARRHRRDIVRR